MEFCHGFSLGRQAGKFTRIARTLAPERVPVITVFAVAASDNRKPLARARRRLSVAERQTGA